jgi:hypothetical protein
MGAIHKTVTAAVLAANQANSAASTGPATEAGKEQSKMNAFKSGKYARRPDPVELLLKGHTEEEEAERQELRAAMVRCYQPPDDFGRLQAEELADLQFEVCRMERAWEVVLARERELLELEQRKRALRLKARGAEQAHTREIYKSGLANQPDSPGKFREMLEVLESLVRQDWSARDVHFFLDRLYGDSWRGVRLNRAFTRAEESENDEAHERAERDFVLEAEREIELVREELAICEQEQGPLSAAGEAARLLEAMGSRKWSSMRQREMFLRRSIDRKVQVLIDLRREANRAECWAAERTGSHPGPHPGTDSTSGPSSGGQKGGAPSEGGPVTEAPSPEATSGGIDSPLQGVNRGTKPPSASLSIPVMKQDESRRPAGRDGSQAQKALEGSDWAFGTVWNQASRA